MIKCKDCEGEMDLYIDKNNPRSVFWLCKECHDLQIIGDAVECDLNNRENK